MRQGDTTKESGEVARLRTAIEKAIKDLEPKPLPEGAVQMPSFTHVRADLCAALERPE